jgi:hypothetical protein
MSAYTLLYYPGFHPNAIWLRRILLLADDVVRIVPADVEADDPDDLLELQNSVPGCLRSLSPEERDVAIETDNMPRLEKAFAFLARSHPKRPKKKITIEISRGSMSIVGHVFLHHAKVSRAIYHELRRHGLLIEDLSELSHDQGFLVVDEAASNLILTQPPQTVPV